MSLNLIINCNFIVFFQPLSIGITTFLLFIIFLIINHYGFLFQFNSKASIFPSLSSPLMYFTITVVCSFSFIVDYTSRLINLLRNQGLSYWLLINKSLKAKKKYSLKLNRAQSFKGNRKLTKGQSKRFSMPFQVFSRKNPLLFNNMYNKQITTHKNKKFLFNPSSKN